MKFRKRPCVVEANQFDGSAACAERLGIGVCKATEVTFVIDTLEGRMLVREGDWVIRGIKNELYACRNDIFQQTYEAVE